MSVTKSKNQTQTQKGGGGYGTPPIYARLRLTQIFFYFFIPMMLKHKG